MFLIVQIFRIAHILAQHGSLTYSEFKSPSLIMFVDKPVVYKCSALVISPKKSKVIKFAVGDISAFTYVQLASSVSGTSLTKEMFFIFTLLCWLKDNCLPLTSGSAPVVGITAAQVANVL